MPKRIRRTSSRPGRAADPGAPAERGPLQYKVVELSTVDEASLEEAVNAWVRQGWTLDGVQFAMRESSKRPSMAFVFFTRAGAAPAEHDAGAARDKLRRLAAEDEPRASDPWVRLARLAGEDEGEEEP